MVCNIFVLIRLLVARSHCCDNCACMHRSCSGCNNSFTKHKSPKIHRALLPLVLNNKNKKGLHVTFNTKCHLPQLDLQVKNDLHLIFFRHSLFENSCLRTITCPSSFMSDYACSSDFLVLLSTMRRQCAPLQIDTWGFAR